MKKIIILLCCFLSITAAAFAAGDRWELVGTDEPNQNSWYVDKQTVKFQDNKTILFWAKVALKNHKYDIKEIKLKYLLSSDRLQLTKMLEIGYSDVGEILWNNNTTKTISVIPGSGHEKLVEFIAKLSSQHEAEKQAKATDEAKAQTEAKAKQEADIQAKAEKPPKESEKGNKSAPQKADIKEKDFNKKADTETAIISKEEKVEKSPASDIEKTTNNHKDVK